MHKLSGSSSKNNPKGFNEATLRIIEALGGDITTGKCLCPVHDDGQRPSLLVSNGTKVPTVVHCFGGDGNHDNEVVAKLKTMGVWPTSKNLSPSTASVAAENKRSLHERRRYAKDLWNALERSNGRSFRMLLRVYLQDNRHISKVPKNALMTMPIAYPDSEVVSHDPGMVFPIRKAGGRFCGIQVTWLNGDLNGKREQEPARQSYGDVKGNFVELEPINYAEPPDTLLIGEGVETVLSGMQVTKLPGIASAGAWNIVTPPQCKHYIILADNGEAGQEWAENMARHLRGMFADSTVQIATPEKPEGAKAGWDWNDALMAGIDPDELGKAIKESPTRDEEEEDDEDDEDGPVQAKQADALIALASDAELFHDDAAIGYADIDVDGHRESWPIRSGGFRDWLLHRYLRANNTAPSEGAMRLAVGTLGAKARFEGQKREVFVRVGGHRGKVYLDLCDPHWQVIEIDAKGWRVTSKAPVRFRRAPGMLPLPVPIKGGSVDDLRPFVNVAGDADFILLVSWLLATYRDCGPYPGLALKGDEGSAKSTLARIVRQLVDPSKVKERRLPREDRDLHIHASKSFMLSFGNVSALPDWLSDSLCSLATGGGFATRALYTDDDEMLFNAMRPVVLNGVEFVTRSDLADRLIFLKLPQIKDRDRRTEQELWAEFEGKRPYIIGALLDAVAHGLKALPHTPIEPYPRMADFAHWITACEGALWEPGEFKAAYADNRAAATLDVLEADPVAGAVRLLMQKMDGPWTGTATELLAELDVVVGEKESKRKYWPGAASVLGQRLRRIKTRLERSGIHVDFEADAKTRLITIKQEPQKQDSKHAVSPVSAVIPKRSQRYGADRTEDSMEGAGVSHAVTKKPLGHKGKDSRDGKDSRMQRLSPKGAAKGNSKFEYRFNTEARERRARRILATRNRGST